MQLDEIPMPTAVAQRPRDARGYPVPAITPWEGVQPQFAANGVARAYICAVERRCSICAEPIAAGPVWRVVNGVEADAIDAAIADGHPYENRAPTVEAPGHRTCMLYAAVVCPYLGRPAARRGLDGSVIGAAPRRGDARGEGGALVGFEQVDFRYVDGVMLFRFRGLIEFLPHQLGEEQLPELIAAIDAERARAAIDAELGPVLHAEPGTSAGPGYLFTDEAAADARFALLLAGRGQRVRLPGRSR